MNDSNADMMRRNRKLGLGLGALAVVISVGFIIHFSIAGLPKDGDVHRVMHSEGRPGHPLGESTDSSTMPRVPATPEPQEDTP